MILTGEINQLLKDTVIKSGQPHRELPQKIPYPALFIRKGKEAMIRNWYYNRSEWANLYYPTKQEAEQFATTLRMPYNVRDTTQGSKLLIGKNNNNCAVCSTPAIVQCSNCSTGYCSSKCQLIDWNENNHIEICTKE